jgi:hypothetical protein
MYPQKNPTIAIFFAFQKQIRCKPYQTVLNLLVREPLQNNEDEVFICSHICGMFTHCYCELRVHSCGNLMEHFLFYLLLV